MDINELEMCVSKHKGSAANYFAATCHNEFIKTNHGTGCPKTKYIL